MEDSQVAVAQATNGTECPSAGKFPAEYTLSSDSTLGCEDHAPPVSSADVVNAETDGSNLGGENVYSHGVSSITGDSTLGVYETKIDDRVTGAVDDRVTGASENLVIQENVAGPPIHEYDVINGSTCETSIYESAAIPNGSLSNEEGGHVLVQQFDEVYSAEEGRLWNMVRADCLDFNSWTALIEETERVAESDILKIRNVYDAFLAEFPLCFGYWKKYADHEGRLDSVDKVVEVYERAVLAVTYSVEIWQHYCVFAISTYEDPDTIRRLFERGLAYVGTDYLSYPLWDEYIRFEESHQNWSHLAMIYSRILENPIQQLDRYFNCFKELASSRPLSEIWTPEEAAMVAATMDSGGHGPQGEILIDDAEQSSKPVSAGLMEAEELEKYIAIREEMYKKAKEFDSKIISFETAIRRPYFHVRPLDDPELDNWHNYLDFIETGDDFNKVVKLYERCLIACASYPKYWIRYALSMEASGSMQLALNALARATQVFVKRQPEIHLFAARFKELNGDVLGARTEYELLYSEISPCLLEAIVKHANMENRLGHKEAALAVYEKIIASEQEKEHSQILPMLLVQYSRFLLLVAANVEKAMEIIDGALGDAQLSKPLLEAIIHLNSIQRSPRCVGHLDSLVEKFITLNDPKVASTTEREEISCIFLEFLDLFGDAESIRKAENRHNMLFLCQKSMSASKKRHAEDYLVSDKAKMAATYSSVPSSAQSVMGPYPNVQNQWPAGNEQRAPAWPPTSQTQSQQWNYGQQADYSGYGYANYGHPQAPPSAPQAAAYGPYPPTYPTQAYPQQSYAQPTSGATFPPQQTAAPQQQPYFPYY